MPRQGNELAAVQGALSLLQIAQSLHKIADRLGQVETLVICADTRDDQFSKTESIVGFRRQSNSSGQGALQNGHLNISETTHQNYRFNATDRNNSRPTLRRPETTTPDGNRSGVIPQFSLNRSNHTSHSHSVPHKDCRSHIDDSPDGCGTQFEYCPPPRPTSEHLVRSVPDPQSPAIHGADPCTTRRTNLRPPQADIEDIYALDESLVQCCDLSKRLIHRPPQGENGSQGRWYYVSRGRKVGIFNEWNDVQMATNGVSSAHQQRVKSEDLAYTFFKRALLSGNVEIIE